MTTPCTVASTSNLVGTYADGVNPGSPGQGATFTFTATGAQFMDGAELVLNLVVLVKDQTAKLQNGVYVVTRAGDVGISCQLTRSSLFYWAGNINDNTLIPVIGGETQFQTVWSLAFPVSSVGVDDIDYIPVANTTTVTKYTVGPTGNYPATPLGLQNALNDANGQSPVFIQSPGFSDGMGTPIIVPDGSVIIGEVSEMPANAFTNQEGQIVFATDTSVANTVIDVVLTMPNSGSVKLENIVYAPTIASVCFPTPQGDNTLNVYLNNAWINCNTASSIVNRGTHVSGDSILKIFMNNSFLAAPGGIVFDLSAGAAGTVTVELYASNNSVIGPGQGSDIANQNVTFKVSLTNGSSYWDSMSTFGTLTGSSATYEFSDCTVGMLFDIPFFASDGVFSAVTVTQQNVNYFADNTCTNTEVFKQVGGVTLTYPGSGNNSNNIGLQNSVWSDVTAVDNAFKSAISGSIDGTGNFINAGNVSCTNLMTAPGGTSDTVTQVFQLTYGASLTFGTPIQNIQGADVMIMGTVLITSSTGATLTMGTASSSTPTADAFTPSITAAAVTAVPFCAYVPKDWYFVLDKTGTITSTNTYIVFPI